MEKIGNYIIGKWFNGQGDGVPVVDAITGDTIALSSTKGIDLKVSWPTDERPEARSSEK